MNIKQLALTLLTSSLPLFSISSLAQQQNLQKYSPLAEPLMEVFLDHVEEYPSALLSMGQDQYLGQVDAQGNIYGFGRYIRQDGVQVFGLFRNGELIQGITLLKESATVGNASHYSSYSLSTGQLEFIFFANQRQLFDTQKLRDYQFLSLAYSNGDQYMGETVRGQRHGLGLYFYANGDIWYGVYQNNARKGYGALFSSDNTITIGHWDGEETFREIFVRQSKGKRRK